jgi:putative membrane protein
VVLAATVIGLPFAVLWILGPGQWWARHYYDRLLCEVSRDELRFRKGIIFTLEKTIPLENIQDVTFIEGPLLRHFHLSTLKFETAGQSAGQAHDMKLVGIIDAHILRGEILERRLAARRRNSAAGTAPAGATESDDVRLLSEINGKLDAIVSLLQSRKS